MYKKLAIIAIICIVVIGVILLVLPRTTSVTLHAVKFDAQGNEIGQVDIPLEYTVKPVFSKNLKKITVGEFDGFGGTEVIATDRATSDLQDYYSITVVIGDSTGDLPTSDHPSLDHLESDSYRCIVSASPDLDRWMIRVLFGNENVEYFYVSSISGDNTPQELLDYFDTSLR